MFLNSAVNIGDKTGKCKKKQAKKRLLMHKVAFRHQEVACACSFSTGWELRAGELPVFCGRPQCRKALPRLSLRQGRR